jgi:SAM-dependent methyltransferase/uncharacterized protein YbaR (Trm112 family)
MKPRLSDLILCPLDRSPLELREWVATPAMLTSAETARIRRLGLDIDKFSREIETGVLVNSKRKVFYPIYHGVPRMLTFPTDATRRFVKEHNDRLKEELYGFTLPDARAMPGEETVLRTFSTEWVNFSWNGDSYWGMTPEVLYDNMRFLLNLDENPVTDRLVLEIGIGIGGIADYMASKEGCELVGLDLSYAVDAAYGVFGKKNPFLHIIQASAFALPFPEKRFDFVYSQGVLHHTHDTRSAFERVSHMPRLGGRLYIWVYSHASEERTPIRRALMIMENVVRPLVWRIPETLQTLALLPIAPLYLLHQNLWVTRHHKDFTKYSWSAAIHAARDRFTPRFAHRHSEAEVCSWFKQAGYSNLQCTSQRAHPERIQEALVGATSVDGTRQTLRAGR